MADAVAKLERVGEGHPLAVARAALQKILPPGGACPELERMFQGKF